jgi:glycosyltransferase involved in cell wall biosynthesis
MDFSIVTPSFKQLEYLGCCIASVADQGAKGSEKVGMCESGKGALLRSVSAGSQSYAGLAEQLSVEHIVQDAGSPGVEEFAERTAERLLRKYGGERVTSLEAFELLHIRTAHGYNLRIFKEKDSGMYDAINKGMKKGMGRVRAYLNCDEQYLQGALKVVREFFENRINVEVVLGDVVIVGRDGEAICHRKMVKPGLAHTWTCHFGALTAGIFFREKLLSEGLLFDTSYRVASDAEWFVRVLRSGKKIEPLRKTTSTFLESGENLGLSPTAKEERERLDDSAPLCLRKLRLLWVLVHRARRLLGTAHRSEDVSYGIYLPKQSERKAYYSKKLRTTWPGRMLNF